MASVNIYFMDVFIAHTIDLMRVSEDVRLTLTGLLLELEKSLMEGLASETVGARTKKRMEALLVQARAQTASTYSSMEASHSSALLSVAGAEVAFFNHVLKKGLGATFPSISLTEQQLLSAASNVLIEGAPSSEWWKIQEQTFQQRFTREIRMGYLQGESVKQLTERVRGLSTSRKVQYRGTDGGLKTTPYYAGGVSSVSIRQAEALARTSVQAVAEDVRLNIIRQHEDVMKGMMWHATLDSRTTPLCRARDGKLYTLEGKPIGHTQPFLGGPPAHWKCRSTLVPVTKSWEELGMDPKIDKIYDDFVKGGKRASMDGALPAATTYGDWFGRLSENRQKDILGLSRWEVWKEKGLSFTDLVDQRGRPLSVVSLKRKYRVED